MHDQAGCSHFRYNTSLKQFERSFQRGFLQEHDFVRVFQFFGKMLKFFNIH